MPKPSTSATAPAQPVGPVTVAILHRFLLSPNSQHKDIVTGNSKSETEVSFKCNIDIDSNMIEEHVDIENSVHYIRFRHLSNPPPSLPLPSYNRVRTLHVSCIFPTRWLFSHFSAMSHLKTVSLGTGCFADDPYTFSPQMSLKLEPSPSVTTFIVRVDLERYKVCAEIIVKHRIATILECAQVCLTSLTSVDFTLPLQADPHLAAFRNKLTQFKSIGTDSRTYETNLLTFRAQVHQESGPSHSQPSSSTNSRANGAKSKKSSSTYNGPQKKRKPEKNETVEVVDVESSDTDEMVSGDDIQDTGKAAQPLMNLPPTPSPEQSMESTASPPPIRPGKTVVTVVQNFTANPRLPHDYPRVSDPRLNPRLTSDRPRAQRPPVQAKNKVPVKAKASPPTKLERANSPSLLEDC